MAILVLKDNLGCYVEYDEETDVMTATHHESRAPEKWLPISNEKDITLGVYTEREKVCVDRYCDEWETQDVDHQVALRMKDAKKRAHIEMDEALVLSMGRGIDITLLNILRHGQIALRGEHWWTIRVKTESKVSWL